VNHKVHWATVDGGNAVLEEARDGISKAFGNHLLIWLSRGRASQKRVGKSPRSESRRDALGRRAGRQQCTVFSGGRGSCSSSIGRRQTGLRATAVARGRVGPG